jgi:hypothetical protein
MRERERERVRENKDKMRYMSLSGLVVWERFL